MPSDTTFERERGQRKEAKRRAALVAAAVVAQRKHVRDTQIQLKADAAARRALA
jgi:hypothetical protein